MQNTSFFSFVCLVLHIVSTYCLCKWHVHKRHAKSAKRPKVAIPGRGHFNQHVHYLWGCWPRVENILHRRVWLVASICLAFLCHMFVMPVFTQALQEKMDGLDDRFLSCLQKGQGMYISWLMSYLQDWTRIPMAYGCLNEQGTCAIYGKHKISWFARRIPCHMYTKTCHTWEETHYFGYPASISNFVVFPFHQQIPSSLSSSPISGVNQDLEKLQSLVTVTRYFFGRQKGVLLTHWADLWNWRKSLHFMAWKAVCG